MHVNLDILQIAQLDSIVKSSVYADAISAQSEMAEMRRIRQLICNHTRDTDTNGFKNLRVQPAIEKVEIRERRTEGTPRICESVVTQADVLNGMGDVFDSIKVIVFQDHDSRWSV